MIRRLGPGALFALLLALLVGVAPADAATGFVRPSTLSSVESTGAHVAMAPNGYAIAGWVESSAGPPVVRVAVRPPGADWSSPESFPVGLTAANDVSVAISSGGAAAVAWEEVTSPSTFNVAVSSRPAGGAFTGVEVVRDGTQSHSPSLGIAADGTVTLLYTFSPSTVALRDFAAGGSVLAAPLQTLAPRCSTSFGNGISVAPSGDAVAPLSCSGASFALRTRAAWTVSPPVEDDINACPSTSIFHDAVMASIDTAGRPVGVMETHVRQPDFSCIGIGGSDSFSEQLVLPLAGVMTPIPGPPVASGSTFGAFAPSRSWRRKRRSPRRGSCSRGARRTCRSDRRRRCASSVRTAAGGVPPCPSDRSRPQAVCSHGSRSRRTAEHCCPGSRGSTTMRRSSRRNARRERTRSGSRPP